GHGGVFFEPVAARGAFDEGAIEIGWKDAGGDAVDADAVLRPLVCQAAGQAHDAAFGARVGEDFGERDEGVERGDVHDGAAQAFAIGGLIFHYPPRRLIDDEISDEVDSYDSLEFGGGHFERWLLFNDPGGIHNGIEATIFSRGTFHRFAN